jgi:dTDP-glucose pyrophosphorylase
LCGYDKYLLVLGDNISLRAILSPDLNVAKACVNNDAVTFTHTASDPRRLRVGEFDEGGHVTSFVEKPTSLLSQDCTFIQMMSLQTKRTLNHQPKESWKSQI